MKLAAHDNSTKNTGALAIGMGGSVLCAFDLGYTREEFLSFAAAAWDTLSSSSPPQPTARLEITQGSEESAQ